MAEQIKLEAMLLTLERYAQEYRTLPQAKEKIQAVQEVLLAYQQQQLPVQPLPELEFSEDFLFEHLDAYPDILELEGTLNDLRQCVIENFGIWHIFSRVWAADLAAYLKQRPTLQVMAGNGVLASQLLNVLATDDFNWEGQDITRPAPWTNVVKIDALAAVQQYYREVEVLLIEWAPDSQEVDYEILRFLRSVKWEGELIVVGEKRGATNSKKFWEQAKLEKIGQLNFHHQPFDFIHDQVYRVR